MLRQRQRRSRLVIWIFVLALIWCVGLPRFARLKPVREHIDAMQAADINVGAMFYTELEWEPPTGAAWR